MKTLLCVLVLAAAAAAYKWEPYIGHQVIKVIPDTAEQLAYLQHLYATNFQLEFVQRPGLVGAAVEVTVAPGDRPALLEALTARGVRHSVSVTDLGEVLKESWEGLLERKARYVAFNYSDFNTFDEILAEVDVLAAQCPGGFTCTVTNIGNSLEGRPLNQLHVTSAKGKPTVWLDATAHAREWLATATMMALMHHMISQYGVDPQATALLNNFDWYLLPVVNPDGYVFSWTDNRMWRKNRRNNVGSLCAGVDINRNFPTLWGQEPGGSPNACASDYFGTEGGSEPETAALMTKASQIADQETLIGWWSIHAYGNFILLPYGDGSPPPHLSNVTRNADAVCAAIMGTFNTQWECDNVREVLYETSGNSNDWATSDLAVTYAYIPEVRGGDFVVSPDEIQPSFEEMWNGLVAFVENF